MSYEIVYSKNFIKTTKGFIPLVLHGSNNCYDWNNRREHYWSTLYHGGGIYTEKELLEKVQSYTGGEYQEHFKMNNHWVDDNGLIKFYKTAIKNAHTIEEYINNGQHTHNGSKWHVSGIKCYLSIWNKEGYDKKRNEHTETIFCTTTEQIENTIATLKAQRENLLKDISIDTVYLCIEYKTNEKIVYNDEQKEFKGQCLVKYGNKYITDIDRDTTITYSRGKDQAYIFECFDKALEYMNSKDSYHKNNMKIVKYDPAKDKKIAEQKVYGIMVNTNYFVKFTKYGFSYSYSSYRARRTFKHEAEKICNKLKSIWKDYFIQVVELKQILD